MTPCPGPGGPDRWTGPGTEASFFPDLGDPACSLCVWHQACNETELLLITASVSLCASFTSAHELLQGAGHPASSSHPELPQEEVHMAEYRKWAYSEHQHSETKPSSCRVSAALTFTLDITAESKTSESQSHDWTNTRDDGRDRKCSVSIHLHPDDGV